MSKASFESLKSPCSDLRCRHQVCDLQRTNKGLEAQLNENMSKFLERERTLKRQMELFDPLEKENERLRLEVVGMVSKIRESQNNVAVMKSSDEKLAAQAHEVEELREAQKQSLREFEMRLEEGEKATQRAEAKAKDAEVGVTARDRAAWERQKEFSKNLVEIQNHVSSAADSVWRSYEILDYQAKRDKLAADRRFGEIGMHIKRAQNLCSLPQPSSTVISYLEHVPGSHDKKVGLPIPPPGDLQNDSRKSLRLSNGERMREDGEIEKQDHEHASKNKE